MPVLEVCNSIHCQERRDKHAPESCICRGPSRAAYVIDGQHRLYGYSSSTRAATDLIPVVAFVSLSRSAQMRMFMDVNENQQAVPKEPAEYTQR